ncbi:GTP pyrophosphokinase family protein [Cytobacillus firmus]|uniref:GTP pyrophosphokinase n=1 Tax=Cytobacillus firmus TaxID=1399 RepID=UPI0036F307C1
MATNTPGQITLESIQQNIRDIAGVRITCSFVSDIYKIKAMLESQKDIAVLECKDYIQHPKPNGYQSLHLIVQIPIFMSDREELVPVEIQIRTIAMDFWASLEHKIYYKYNKEIPQRILKGGKKRLAIRRNKICRKLLFSICLKTNGKT